MNDTLRLLMPQWQGGNNPHYYLGAKLLAWLAPNKGDTLEAEVPVPLYDGTELPVENGVVAQSLLLQLVDSAHSIIEGCKPKRIITLGGDCLISQAPFAYLNEIYDGRLGVLWIDAHPDISTPGMHPHEHAMVLGNLLGEGDKEFSSRVKIPLVMYAGLQRLLSDEDVIVDRLKLRKAGSAELENTSRPVLEWIRENQIEHLAIHLDLDVLDPTLFRSLTSAEPGDIDYVAAKGKMTLGQVSRLIQDVSEKTEIVGLSIAEYLPWDAINLQNFLNTLPVF